MPGLGFYGVPSISGRHAIVGPIFECCNPVISLTLFKMVIKGNSERSTTRIPSISAQRPGSQNEICYNSDLFSRHGIGSHTFDQGQ